MRYRVIAGVVACASFCVLSACHMRGGEPSARELRSALQADFERQNGKGGLVIDTGNAGSFTRLQFRLELHNVIKHSCVGNGSKNMWKCEVTLSISTPPLHEPPKDIDQTVTMFDGPDGWKVVQ